jgi:predicted PurR-regulated permease PerM
MGIIIGPVLIAVLKAVMDTLTLDLGFPEDEPLADAAHE